VGRKGNFRRKMGLNTGTRHEKDEEDGGGNNDDRKNRKGSFPERIGSAFRDKQG